MLCDPCGCGHSLSRNTTTFTLPALSLYSTLAQSTVPRSVTCTRGVAPPPQSAASQVAKAARRNGRAALALICFEPSFCIAKPRQLRVQTRGVPQSSGVGGSHDVPSLLLHVVARHHASASAAHAVVAT